MPGRLAEPNLGGVSQPCKATLGTTIKVKQIQAPGHPHIQASANDHGHQLRFFDNLPPEVCLNIMAHIDPVSQICLGLTSRSLHRTFHDIYGAEHAGWNIKRYPFDLRMQRSVCGQYMLNWWWDDSYLRFGTDILWDRKLGELLSEEKWLWGDLKFCEECWKYKPTEAYVGCVWEETMMSTYMYLFPMVGPEYEEFPVGCCRRCRAKWILRTFDSKYEIFDDGEAGVKGPSLGLVRFGTKKQEVDKMPRNWQEWHALNNGYETWEDIFEELDI